MKTDVDLLGIHYIYLYREPGETLYIFFSRDLYSRFSTWCSVDLPRVGGSARFDSDIFFGDANLVIIPCGGCGECEAEIYTTREIKSCAGCINLSNRWKTF